MADQILATNPADFGIASTRWEGVATRVRVRDNDGDHDAYRLPDGTLVAKTLRVPSAARAAADAVTSAAAKTERDAVDTKTVAARAAIKAELDRIKAKSVATRTTTEKALQGLVYLLTRDE